MWDLSNITEQSTVILGLAMERENRDRGRGVGDAVLDMADKKPQTVTQKNKEMKHYGTE